MEVGRSLSTKALCLCRSSEDVSSPLSLSLSLSHTHTHTRIHTYTSTRKHTRHVHGRWIGLAGSRTRAFCRLRAKWLYSAKTTKDTR